MWDWSCFGVLYLNAVGKKVRFSDIREEDLSKLLPWYSGEEYTFAIGKDSRANMETLQKRLHEAEKSKYIFFVGIYLIGDDKPIGFLKGAIRSDNEDIVWMHTLMIDSRYQNQGWGSRSLTLFFETIQQKYNRKQVYISVAQANPKGMAFWKKHGFYVIKTIHKYIPATNKEEQLCIMRKEL